MRVLGLVPARGGSRRMPRKNLALLGGKTLVRRTLEVASRAACLHAVALSSDDEEILDEGRAVPGVVALRRPAELATDEALALDVAAHALASLERDALGPFDAVAIVQCTSPFTTPGDIAGTIDLLRRSGAGSAVSIVRVNHALHPLKLKRLEGDRLVPFLSDDGLAPAERLPELWLRNGSVYASRRETIASGRLLSDDVRGYPMPEERSHDINTPLDLAFAEFLVASGRSTLPS